MRRVLHGENVPGLRVLHYTRGREFEGNEAAELGIFSLIDHTHPTAAQPLDDAVVRNRLTDHFAEILDRGWRQVNGSQRVEEGPDRF